MSSTLSVTTTPSHPSATSSSSPLSSTSPSSLPTTSSPSGGASLASPSSVPAFPHAGLLPKAETQALSFLAVRPECDGRGVTVAIFDTGTDVAAPGLRTTTEGKPKILSAWDCSGSGDVDISESRTAETAGEGEDSASSTFISALSGRRVNVDSLSAKDGRFLVGVKRAYELFPEPLVARLKRQRRKGWDDRQRQLETALQRGVQDTEDGSKERTDAELRYKEVKAMAKGRRPHRLRIPLPLASTHSTHLHPFPLPPLLLLALAAYEDPGPIFDVLVFQSTATDDDWTAVVVSEDAEGQPVLSRPLRPYHEHREFDTFSGDDLMHYSITLDVESHTCTLVVQAGSHGTHVAGIVAAHFPEQPDLNGQAPGAQLVSVKIVAGRSTTAAFASSRLPALQY